MDDDVTDSLHSTWIYSVSEIAELADRHFPGWGVIRLGYAYRALVSETIHYRYPFVNADGLTR